jgi:hypothetical protein
VVSVTPRPRFAPRERTPGTHCTGGWVGPRAGLDTEARGKIFCPCRGSNPGRPVRSQTLYCLSYKQTIPAFTWKDWEKPRKICQDSCSPGRNLSQGPSEYEAGVLVTMFVAAGCINCRGSWSVRGYVCSMKWTVKQEFASHTEIRSQIEVFEKGALRRIFVLEESDVSWTPAPKQHQWIQYRASSIHLHPHRFVYPFIVMEERNLRLSPLSIHF